MVHNFLISQSEVLSTVLIDISQYQVSDLMGRTIFWLNGKYRIKKTRCEQSLDYISRRLLRCKEKTFTTAFKSSVKNGQRLKNPKNRFPDLLKSASQNCAVSEFISTVLHLLWKKEIKISELSIISLIILPPFKNLWKFKVALNSLYKIFWNSLNLIKLITIRLNNGRLRGC